jgi:hypothetical protein
VLSAVLARVIAVLNARLSNATRGDLAHAFIESFKASLYTIIGLLGARNHDRLSIWRHRSVNECGMTMGTFRGLSA